MKHDGKSNSINSKNDINRGMNPEKMIRAVLRKDIEQCKQINSIMFEQPTKKYLDVMALENNYSVSS